MSENWSEIIFESLLKESLSGRHPPDLTAQILQRWQQELREGESASRSADQPPAAPPLSYESPASLPFASAPFVFPSTSSNPLHPIPPTPPPAPPVVASAKQIHRAAHPSDQREFTSGKPANEFHVQRVRRFGSKGNRAAWGSALAVAVGGLLCVSLWQVWFEGRDGGIAADTASDVGSGSGSDVSGNRLAAGGTQHEVAPLVAGASRATQAGQVLSVEDVPFSGANGLPTFSALTQPAPATLEVLDDAAVVELIDERLERLWKLVGAPTAKGVEKGILQQRLQAVLLGGRQLGASGGSPTGDAPLSGGIEGKSFEVSELVRSPEFAEHTAALIAQLWLPTSNATQAEAGDDAQRLREFLRDQIARQVPWNQIIAAVIGSSADDREGAVLRQFAGGENHALVERLGQVMFGESVGCARCHDASQNGRVISIDQSEYWSLVAFFRGVDGQTLDASAGPGGSGDMRSFIDRQAELLAEAKFPQVFFERPDRRLQAAVLRLPGGGDWTSVADARTPRTALANWIHDSNATDQAAVSLAWRLVFGRPLVGRHLALDSIGLAERQALRVELARQFAAHNRDFSRLVGWLAESRAFAAPALDIDRQKWLVAEERELDAWQISAAVFASYYRRPAQASPLSLDSAIASVIRWKAADTESRTLLAQPVPAVPLDGGVPGVGSSSGAGAVGKKPASPATDLPPAAFLLMSHRPTEDQLNFVERLLTSQLTWEQQVSHIAQMVGVPGSQVQQSADQLLQTLSGDRKAALQQLLHSVMLFELSQL
jgi:hypothetical protein